MWYCICNAVFTISSDVIQTGTSRLVQQYLSVNTKERMCMTEVSNLEIIKKMFLF